MSSDLKDKEVINLSTNEKLGFVNDFEICTLSGEVSAILVPEKNKFFSSSKNKGLRIPWNKITGIGEDIILVNIDTQE